MSTVPTPANNLNGQGQGQEGDSDEGQGLGHVDPTNPRGTMGKFLGLHEQKTRAENKYMARADYTAANVKPMSENGEPTCASEDHTFMYHKPGGNDTWPGWDTFKNIFGK
ncbi:hypothetical protein N7492_005896 [Penicillium capsulatum]|uniref:Uncharacterized protein n=1 Tax=Penicillium capsulatum TaxID=69766 RepID=A0A9W9LSK7_9EURO|nr:hypothetical protein N7492_005896 [Penicillium capsulatum]